MPTDDIYTRLQIALHDARKNVSLLDALREIEALRAKLDTCWQPWAGGECPVEPGTLVDVRHRNGDSYSNEPAARLGSMARNWDNDGVGGDIVAWRLSRLTEPTPTDDDWQSWEGGDCPVLVGTLVDVRHRSGAEHLLVPAGTDGIYACSWWHYGSPGDIVAWRLSQ